MNADALLAEILANPDDDAPRLVYADWLEDHGETGRAEFIRLQYRFAALNLDDFSPGAQALRDEYHKAGQTHHEILCRQIGVPEQKQWAVHCGFHRGFLDSLSIPVQWFIAGAEALERAAPLLRGLTVGRVNGWGERLAQVRLLERITDLEVEAWIAPADARAIASSEHLRQLRSLEIWLGNRSGGNEETLAAFAGGVARAYPNLSELRIVDIPGCSTATIAEANRRAGRPIARAVIPLPRLYPIAADFGLWMFAGRLPDGTQVLAETYEGMDARLFLFTPTGAQIEIRELPLPPECYPLPEDEHGWEHTWRVQDHLRREMGFTPELLRILDIDDPTGHNHISPYSHHAEEEYFGYPDDPDIRPEDDGDNCEGRAANSNYWLKHGTYVFWCGNDWWVGPDGTVEST
jgi:uncharacterized protein (TIGR02996 family)